MDTEFYQNDLENQISLDITPIRMVPVEDKVIFPEYVSDEKQKGYLTRYLNPERNSRFNSVLPKSDLWEVSWMTEMDSTRAPWYLLIKDERLLLQNESGWQLFSLSGKKIAEGIKSEGEIIIAKSDDTFYINDPSGFLQAINLMSGSRSFYVYPYLGKGFTRSVIYTNGNKIIEAGFELPIMTHESPIRIPEVNILEILKINSKETDQDGILLSPVQNENLMLKSGKMITAVHDSTIIIAVPNYIYFINTDLKVTKALTENFIPLEMSIDEQMRIYLVVEIQKGDELKSEYWFVDTNGEIIVRKEIPPVEKNYLAPPAIDYKHNAYIVYEQKILAISPSGYILWEEYIQKPLGGISAEKDLLIACEGGLLTAFDNKGIRKFIYNFDDDLTTAPLLYNDQVYVATRKNLYCLTPKK